MPAPQRFSIAPTATARSHCARANWSQFGVTAFDGQVAPSVADRAICACALTARGSGNGGVSAVLKLRWYHVAGRGFLPPCLAQPRCLRRIHVLNALTDVATRFVTFLIKNKRGGRQQQCALISRLHLEYPYSVLSTVFCSRCVCCGDVLYQIFFCLPCSALYWTTLLFCTFFMRCLREPAWHFLFSPNGAPCFGHFVVDALFPGDRGGQLE